MSQSSCHSSEGGHDPHKGHGSEGSHHNMGDSAAKNFLKRFWVVTFLLIPLLFTNESVADFLNIPYITANKWLQFSIATIIFGFALVFFKHAKHEIKMKKYGMMTLVSLAVGAGYLFSAISTFIPALEAEFYLEISTLIWVLLFGHYLEARSGSVASNALKEVAKLLPKMAHKLENGEEIEVPIDELSEGDIVRVKAGEKIPADGHIEEGGANVDESLISGESKPIKKLKNDSVVAGSLCLDGSLTVKLTRVGEHSTIGQIQALIAEAQKTKPTSQRLADKASGVLTFIAGGTAILTLLVWSVVLGEPFVFAVTLAITVLVIACPHALGLAIPTVTTITTSLAVKNGVFLKNMAKLEVIKKADYIVFDKTGTLTKGEFGVTDVVPMTSVTKEDIIRLAASLDQHSSHVIGDAIVKYAKENGASLESTQEFSNISGKGVSGEISGEVYYLGNKALITEKSYIDGNAQNVYEDLLNKGKTTILLANNKEVLGVIALADSIKDESKKAVELLHDMAIKVAMLTGDNKTVAKGVAEELGVDTYFAEVLPEDKYKHIQSLQKDGSVVIMVGDGVNDAPALTQADVGIAIGAGTDVAVEAGDVVLTKNNPLDVVRLLILSKKVYRKMIENLVWALGYNVIAIPAAAGVFATWGFFLRPEIGALVMSLSTVVVVINALTLKRIDLKLT